MPGKRYFEDTLYLAYVKFMPYYHARLVMKRHLYGSTHGLPIEKIEKRAESYRDSDGVMTVLSQQARIVNGRLLVPSIMTVSHPRGDAASLRRSIDNRGENVVCGHISMRKRSPRFGPG
jgi:hypothetical protein